MDGAGLVLLGGLHDGATEKNFSEGIVAAITGDEQNTVELIMVGVTTRQIAEMEAAGRRPEELPALRYERTDEFDADGRTVYRFVP